MQNSDSVSKFPRRLDAKNGIWKSFILEGCQAIVIYIDFSKAFDVVQHDKLFCKLRACGVDGLLFVVASYLLWSDVITL